MPRPSSVYGERGPICCVRQLKQRIPATRRHTTGAAMTFLPSSPSRAEPFCRMAPANAPARCVPASLLRSRGSALCHGPCFSFRLLAQVDGAAEQTAGIHASRQSRRRCGVGAAALLLPPGRGRLVRCPLGDRVGRASIVCEHGAQALALPRRSGSRRLFGQGARCSSIPKVMEPTCTLSLLGRKQDCVLQRSQPSARRRFAMLAQVLCPGRRHRHEHAASRRTMTRDEASVVGVLPHGKARTRRPPRLQHVGVGAGLGAHPLEQVEDQGVDGVGHRACCGLAQLGQLHRLVGHVDGAHDGGRGSTLRRFRCSRFSANRRSMRHCYGVST
jgi:hypothetical protein